MYGTLATFARNPLNSFLIIWLPRTVKNGKLCSVFVERKGPFIRYPLTVKHWHATFHRLVKFRVGSSIVSTPLMLKDQLLAKCEL